jgi:lysophospholipase L1-like esterase
MGLTWLSGKLFRLLMIPLLLVPAVMFSSSALAAPGSTIDYFALGDSIASGHGLVGDDGFPCDRSSLAYPNLVRKWLENQRHTVNFTMLACSGAVTSADTQGIVGCQQNPQAVADTTRADECQYESLQNQVAYVLDHLSSAPALVTITAGINDAGWSDCPSLADCVLRNWLIESDAAYQQNINDITASVKANLEQELDSLLAQPNVTVVFTDYYNPFNTGSWFFPLLVNGPQTLGALLTLSNPVIGAALLLYLAQHHLFVQQSCLTAEAHPTAGYEMTCYERTDYGVNTIDAMYQQLASEHAGRVFVAQLHDRFQAHAAPSPVCGSDAPGTADTWIQYPGGNRARGFLPFEQPKILNGNDCFHPNVTGAGMIAEYLEEVISTLSF